MRDDSKGFPYSPPSAVFPGCSLNHSLAAVYPQFAVLPRRSPPGPGSSRRGSLPPVREPSPPTLDAPPLTPCPLSTLQSTLQPARPSLTTVAHLGKKVKVMSWLKAVWTPSPEGAGTAPANSVTAAAFRARAFLKAAGPSGDTGVRTQSCLVTCFGKCRNSSLPPTLAVTATVFKTHAFKGPARRLRSGTGAKTQAFARSAQVCLGFQI